MDSLVVVRMANSVRAQGNHTVEVGLPRERPKMGHETQQPTLEIAEGDLLTAQQASRICSLPVSTLHDYAVRAEAGGPRQGPVHVRLGPRRRRWLRHDVETWIAANRVG